MNGGQTIGSNTGFGMVFLVALLGLALASLVVLTPWHSTDLPGGSHSRAVVEKQAHGRAAR